MNVGSVPVQAIHSPEEMLVFADPFDGGSIDTSRWLTTDTEHRLDQAEECINVPRDPSFERAPVGGIAGGWTYEHSNADLDDNVTYSVDTDTPRGAGVSQKIAIAAVVAATRTAILRPLAAERYATVPGEVWSALISLKVAAISGVTVVARIVPRDAAGTRLATSSSTSFTAVTAGANGWVQTAVVGYTMPATTASVELDVYTSSIDNGDSLTLYVDDVLLCKKAYLPGPWFCGDSPGCSWAGVAHASTSTRPDPTQNTAQDPSFERGDLGADGISDGWANTSDAELAGKVVYSLDADTPRGVGVSQKVTIAALAGLTAQRSQRIDAVTAERAAAGAGQIWTASIALKVSAIVGCQAYLAGRYFDGTGAVVGSFDSGAAVTAPSGWAQLTAKGTAPATTATVAARLIVNQLDNGDSATVYWDDCQVEQKGYASTYTDGSLGANYSWDGAAHASTSRRNVPATPAGALICRGGTAAPAWDNPRDTAVYTVVPRAGLTLEIPAVFGNPAWAADFGFDLTSPVARGTRPGFEISTLGTGELIAVTDAGTRGTGFVIVAGRLYWLRVTHLGAGIHWEVSQDNRATWLTLWVTQTVEPSVVALGFTNYNQRMYLPSPGVRLYRRVPPGPVVSDPTAGVVTPTLDGELLADTSLEVNYTAGLCDTLAVGIGAPTVAQSADAHSGAKAQQFTATANGDYLNDAVAPAASVNGDYYLATIWAKRTAGAAGTARFACYDGNAIQLGPALTGAAYAQKVMVVRTTDVDAWPTAGYQYGNAPFDTVLLDDRSWQHIAWSTMFGPAWTVPAGNQHVKITLDSDPGYTHAGLAWYVDDNNWLAIYHRGGSGYVLQRSAGTYTQLATAVKAWAASQQIEATLNGTSLGAYVGGTQIGGTLTVPAAISTATQVRRFSTWSGNQLSGLSVWGPTS